MTDNSTFSLKGFSIDPLPTLFVKDTEPAPNYSSRKLRQYADLYYKHEHEAHVRLGEHHSIVHYYGWDHRGHLFQRHQAGDILTHLLNHRHAIPPLAVRMQWATDIAEGMAYMHSKAVIWLDVSLSNVLLSDDFQHAVLCDMAGTAIIPLSGHKHLPEVLGDAMINIAPFMAMPNYTHVYHWEGPDGETFSEITPSHDRFGFGIMLFTLLTLRNPHSRFLVI